MHYFCSCEYSDNLEFILVIRGENADYLFGGYDAFMEQPPSGTFMVKGWKSKIIEVLWRK